MKDIFKILDALSIEGFKAAKDFAATKNTRTPVHETADGLYFITGYTGYLCWNTNDYNFYGPTSPYNITKFPHCLNGCPYELHYVESVIKGKVIPKALKSVITDKYTRFYAAKKESTSLILIYSDPYVLSYVMPTKIKEEKTK